MPQWLTNAPLSIPNYKWLLLLVVFVLSFITEKLMRVYATKVLLHFLNGLKISLPDKIKKSITFPIGIMTFSGTWIVGIRLLSLPTNLDIFFSKTGELGIAVGLVMTFYALVDIIIAYLNKIAIQTETKFDDILVPLIQKALKTFVIAMGIVFIGDTLSLDMKGLLTGLGIGGIAFALAAKDTLSNLFGSLTVIIDRPFTIGDWVVIDGKIEGTVEQVGLRSTRIRTFYDSLITVPNGTLTNTHIDNYGMRRFRRFSTKIGVQYDTPPEKLEAFCEGIRQIIVNHKWTRKDYFHVYFNEFAESSLNILLYVFWEVPDWASELHERHRLLMDILRLGHDLGIDFAFPTQTLHVYSRGPQEDRNTISSIEQAYIEGQSVAQQIISKPFTLKKNRSSSHEGSLPKDELSL